MADGTVMVDSNELHRHCSALLVALGVEESQADLVAETLVEADLRGVHSHGAHLMALYVGRIQSGHIHSDAVIRVVEDSGSTVVLDGGLGLGQPVGAHAVDLAVARAKERGLAAVGVRELTHLGALGYYTLRGARQGCATLIVQNGPALVPAFGGVNAIFSTNPFSYAFPAHDEPPIVFDVATTAVAGSKINLAKKRGDPTIPPGWATDDRGRPTTDTEAASIDHLQWFGGHKGYGIAFFVEVMAGLLADSCFGRTEHTSSALKGRDRIAKGAFFLAIDVTRFLPGDAFGRHLDRLIQDVHQSDPAEGVDRVYVPGELEHLTRSDRLVSGIPMPVALRDELAEFAAQLGVPPLVVREDGPS